jgi:surface carbohydrate biosynthesis protein
MASLLAERGVEAYLVPMYDQRVHIFSIMPRFILANFARPANGRLLKAYHGAGILVGVLDTEGGVVQDEFTELLNGVAASGATDSIDHYFFWGRRPYLGFIKMFGSGMTQSHLAGCPRFDFLHPRWTDAVPRPKIEWETYVLVATSFSLNNPRFGSPGREVGVTAAAMALDRQEVQDRQRILDDIMAEFLLLLDKMFRAHPDQRFVVRPHPFESEAPYVSRFRHYSNVRIRRDGNVVAWIKHAQFVVLYNSSIVYEAGFLEKPVLSPEFLAHPKTRIPHISNCALQVNSEREFLEMVDDLCRGSRNDRLAALAEGVRQNLESVVPDWFHAIDGGSTERVADRIAEIVSNPRSRREDGDPGESGMSDMGKKEWMGRYRSVRDTLLRWFDPKARFSRSAKSFSEADVRGILALLASRRMDVEARSFFNPSRPGWSSSIRIRG